MDLGSFYILLIYWDKWSLLANEMVHDAEPYFV